MARPTLENQKQMDWFNKDLPNSTNTKRFRRRRLDLTLPFCLAWCHHPLGVIFCSFHLNSFPALLADPPRAAKVWLLPTILLTQNPPNYFGSILPNQTMKNSKRDPMLRILRHTSNTSNLTGRNFWLSHSKNQILWNDSNQRHSSFTWRWSIIRIQTWRNLSILQDECSGPAPS